MNESEKESTGFGGYMFYAILGGKITLGFDKKKGVRWRENQHFKHFELINDQINGLLNKLEFKVFLFSHLFKLSN